MAILKQDINSEFYQQWIQNEDGIHIGNVQKQDSEKILKLCNSKTTWDL